MKRYYIGEYNDNCADEIDLEGYKLFTGEEKLDFEANWNSAKSRYTVSVGNCGEIDYKNGKEVLKNIIFYEISEFTYNELIKLELFEYSQFFPEFEDYEENE
jgi:hypothetical protein